MGSRGRATLRVWAEPTVSILNAVKVIGYLIARHHEEQRQPASRKFAKILLAGFPYLGYNRVKTVNFYVHLNPKEKPP